MNKSQSRDGSNRRDSYACTHLEHLFARFPIQQIRQSHAHAGQRRKRLRVPQHRVSGGRRGRARAETEEGRERGRRGARRVQRGVGEEDLRQMVSGRERERERQTERET